MFIDLGAAGREKQHQWVASQTCPNWRSNLQPRYVPAQESNLQPLDVWDNTLISWATQPGQKCIKKKLGKIKTEASHKRIYKGTISKWKCSLIISQQGNKNGNYMLNIITNLPAELKLKRLPYQIRTRCTAPAFSYTLGKSVKWYKLQEKINQFL